MPEEAGFRVLAKSAGNPVPACWPGTFWKCSAVMNLRTLEVNPALRPSGGVFGVAFARFLLEGKDCVAGKGRLGAKLAYSPRLGANKVKRRRGRN